MTGSQGKEAPARRGGKAYLAASFAAQFCALARYTLLARLLGPDQLGIAVALILTSQFFESITDSGSDRFLVQDKQGDEPEVQRLVHLVWLGRGLMIGASLVALAIPLAQFYGAPELRTAFIFFALTPLIAGFAHLDYRRLQRKSDFRAESRALVSSEVVSLAVTGIVAYLTRDYTAIICGLIARSIVLVLVSHLTAERRYSVGYSQDHAGRLAKFGLPLMMNGLLLFLGSQGDRLLIGKQIGLTELGHYSAALLLIYYPTGMIQRYMTTMHLPLLAGAESKGSKLAAADRLAGQTLLLTVLMAAGYAAVAPVMIVLLYGEQFRQPALLVAAIGILQASRFIRLWPVTIALAEGRSGLVLISNLVRLLAFPGAFLGVDLVGGIFGILLAFAAAEALALIVTVVMVSRHFAVPLQGGFSRIAAFTLSSAVILGWAAAVGQRVGSGELVVLVAGSLLLVAWLIRSEKRTVSEAVRMLRPAAR